MLVRSPGWTHLVVASGAPKDAVAKKPLWGFWLCVVYLPYMPRPKKQATAPEQAAQALYYMGLPAIITHTHEDGHLDIVVDYSGKIVPKLRVSPESVESKKAS